MFLCLFQFGPDVWARKKGAPIFGAVNYYSFDDIKVKSNTEIAKLLPSLEAELGVRVFNIFSILFLAEQSVEIDRKGYGIGGRIDLPGFLLFNPKQKDLSIKAKNYPLNTSAFLKVKIMDITRASSEPVTTIVSHYGFSLDIFLFNPYVYLTGTISVYSLQGNAYVGYGSGLGWQF